MDERRQQLIERIFIEAIELRESGCTSSRIAELLEDRCNGDASLRAEIESLLGAHGDAEGVLDRADIVLAGTISPTAGGSRHAGRLPWEEPKLSQGTVVGGYTIQRVLGSGGMGVVYVAQQDRPRRTVALKVIRPAMISPPMLRRFEAEAEILGRLHHPGIAQIFEAGVADGRPFLAMELVDGPSLIEHADRAHFGTRERLELVARVCDAVQHAHQKGVIHRDLKPSNILVEAVSGPNDGADSGSTIFAIGQPKVLDFGVARATDSDMQVSTLRTSVGQLIGTLPYMSPEQVAGDQNEVDTRSDVYALGVILYQLLAGKLPHDVSSRSIPEAARVIRDEHPSRLSAISRVFRGEIETIVAKAMDKDRTRRYQSAAELRDDLRRHLAGEPIAAKRDSAMYLLRTQLRRYKGTVAAAAVFVLLLLVFSIYATVQASTKASLARSLATQLSASNIERGRALALAGSPAVGEVVLWRELLQNPESLQARWALWEHYLQRPILRAIRKGDFQASDVAVSRDGKFIALRGTSQFVQVWSGAFDSLLHTLDVGEPTTSALGFSPDGAMLITGGESGALRTWDTHTGLNLGEFTGSLGPVYAIDFSADGRWLAAGSRGGAISVWDTASRSLVRTWKAHPEAVWDVAFSDDGMLLASCGREPRVCLWEMRAFSRAGVVQGTGDEFRAVDLVAGSKVLLAEEFNGTVGVYSTTDGSTLGSLRRSGSATHSFAVSEDESTLVVGGSGSIEVWDLPGQTLLATLTHGDGADYRVALHPVDGTVITAASTGRVMLWESAPGKCADALCADHGAWVVGLDVSDDGMLIASCDLARRVRVWDAASRRELACYVEGGGGSARSPRFSPDGRLLAIGLGNGRVTLRDTTTWQIVRELSHASPSQVCSLAWSPDSAHLLTGTVEGDVTVWDASTGMELAKLDSPKEGRSTPTATGIPRIDGRALSASWSADGTMLAVTATDPMLSVWNARTFKPVFTLPGKYAAWSAAFSPDSKTLAVAMPTRELALFDTATWRVRSSFEGHSKSVLTVTFSPDGKLLASCGVDGTIRLWDPSIRADESVESAADSGRQLAILSHENFEISRIAFGADSRTLYSAGADRLIRAWDLGYYNRHIAGNLDAFMDRLLPKMTPRPDTRSLEAWAESVLATESKLDRLPASLQSPSSIKQTPEAGAK